MCSKWIRWRSLYLIAVLLAFPLAYLRWGIDLHIKWELQRLGRQINGADVNIGSVTTRLFESTIDINRIQLGDASLPMKNWLEIDRVKIFFEPGPLLKKKIILSQVTVEGIRQVTNRETSAIVEGTALNLTNTHFFDQIASGLYATVRSTIPENPLTQVDQLAGGSDLHAKVEKLHHQLGTFQRLRDFRKQLEAAEVKIKAQSETLPSAASLAALKQKFEGFPNEKDVLGRSLASLPEWASLVNDLREKKEHTKKLLDQIMVPLKEARSTVDDLEPLVKEDIQLLRTKLNLPRMEWDDLTAPVLGPVLLRALEKYTFWTDIIRTQMPAAHTKRSGQNTLTVQTKNEESVVHYGRSGELPSFLLRKMTINSSAGDPNQGEVKGFVEGLTLDPASYGWVMKAELQADFPKSKIKGVNFKIEVDHRAEKAIEKFELKLDSFPIEDWMLTQSNDLRFRIARGKGSLDATGLTNDDTIDFQWKLNVSEADYEVYSRYNMIESTLKDLISSLYDFSCTGRISGKTTHPTLALESDFGKHLATGLQKEFKHQIAAIDENLRTNIYEQIGLQRQLVRDKLREIEEGVLQPYHAAARDIQAIENLTDNKVKTLRTSSNQ
jgi:uncharacterized protein (TIGR03545 family)